MSWAKGKPSMPKVHHNDAAKVEMPTLEEAFGGGPKKSSAPSEKASAPRKDVEEKGCAPQLIPSSCAPSIPKVVTTERNEGSQSSVDFCSPLPLVDIGVNLGDDQFHGVYRGKRAHDDDFKLVMQRAQRFGVRAMVITAGSLSEAKHCVKMCRDLNSDYPRIAATASPSASSTSAADPKAKPQGTSAKAAVTNSYYCTVGCHPTRCDEFLKKAPTPADYLDGLRKVIEDNRDVVVAIGECGLDYDRLFFCEKDIQLKFFPLHFQLASEFELPMFLHDRNTGTDFLDIIRANRQLMKGGGVVHSFTGNVAELNEILKLDLYVSVNGCSFKTEENLEAVRKIPLDRLLLETDAPWCDIRPTHASWAFLPEQLLRSDATTASAPKKKGNQRRDVTPTDTQPGEWAQLLPPWPDSKKVENFSMGSLVKGRNEPCAMARVLQVVYGLRKGEVDSALHLAQIVYANTCKLFKLTL